MSPTDLVLDIWREACRHIEIAESIELIGRRIGIEIPGDVCIIRRLDPERLLVETTGAGRMRDHVTVPVWPARSECPARAFQTVMAWSREGRVRAGRSGAADPVILALTPEGCGGACLVGPLRHDSGLLGAILVVGRDDVPFTPAHERLLESLLEPLAVALANHHRLHDMARMRQALEADKLALLSRLGRPDVVDAIVGGDTGLREVMERVDQVAQTDVPVLLIGETGTGKEVVARAVHARSRRAAAPVVRVNCGAIPADLVDSELFGHEKGAFTGAVAQRQGLVRTGRRRHALSRRGRRAAARRAGAAAARPAGRQLRARRAASVRSRWMSASSPRHIATCTRWSPSGRSAKTSGTGSGCSPSAFPRCASGRKTSRSWPPISPHVPGSGSAGTNCAVSPRDLALLQAHPWPGNVRELGAVIERAAIFGGGRELRIAEALGVSSDVSARKHGGAMPLGGAVAALPTSARHLAESRTDAVSYDDVQRAHIMDVVARAGGRIDGAQGAAALLCINPHTLRARMRKLGIAPATFRRSQATAPGPRPHARETTRANRTEDTGAARLDETMRRHVEGILRASDGRIEGPRGAAALLGVNPHTLRARMRKLGIDWAAFRLGR